jgi:hypothetical protein
MSSSASSTKAVQQPDSPLHRTVAPFAASISSSSNDITQNRRSASIDEPVVAAASTSSRGGHRSRPSTSALLSSETSDFEDEESARNRQRRLRDYEEDEGGVKGVWRRATRPFKGVQSAFKKNEGAFSSLLFASSGHPW